MNRIAVTLLLLSSILLGCDKTPAVPEEWRWSQERITNTERLASEGNIDAGRALWSYYAVHGDIDNTAKWKNWLVVRKDNEATLSLATEIYSYARTLPEHNDERRRELYHAKRLMDDWISINGKGDRSQTEFYHRINEDIRKIEFSGNRSD